MPAHSPATDAADKVDKTILEAEKSVHELTQRAERVVQDGLEKLRAQSRVYADEAERSLESAQKTLKEAQTYVTERVHERPLTVTVAALGLGVLVGLLMGGRRR